MEQYFNDMIYSHTAFERLRKQSGNVTAILWTSGLTAKEWEVNYLSPEDYIIQVWESCEYSHYNLVILHQQAFIVKPNVAVGVNIILFNSLSIYGLLM